MTGTRLPADFFSLLLQIVTGKGVGIHNDDTARFYVIIRAGFERRVSWLPTLVANRRGVNTSLAGKIDLCRRRSQCPTNGARISAG